MNNQGSVGYQILSVMKSIIRPGRSWYRNKQYHRDSEVFRGIGPMRNMSAEVHPFSHFIYSTWPTTKELRNITQEMAQPYISELICLEHTRVRIGRACSSIHQMDTTSWEVGIFSEDWPVAPSHMSEGGLGGFFSEPRTKACTNEQIQQFIARITPGDSVEVRLACWMSAADPRVNDAGYLRSQGGGSLADCEKSSICVFSYVQTRKTGVGRSTLYIQYWVSMGDDVNA